MKTKTRKQTGQGLAFNISIASAAYSSAFAKAKQGLNETAIMIDIDIRGAYHLTDDSVMQVVRAAAKTGFLCARAGVELLDGLRLMQEEIVRRHKKERR